MSVSVLVILLQRKCNVTFLHYCITKKVIASDSYHSGNIETVTVSVSYCFRRSTIASIVFDSYRFRKMEISIKYNAVIS
jgi:hypothetical protein